MLRAQAIALILILSVVFQGHAESQCARLFPAVQRPLLASRSVYGPKMTYVSTAKGPLRKVLRIGSYNIENLFSHIPKQDAQYSPVKERERRLGNARAIQKINPDFQVLVEVEDIVALRNFNRDYLRNEYEPLLIDGNDSRGIDVALLVKRDLPVVVEYRSFKSYPGASGNPVFSRDVPAALVFAKDANNRATGNPLFVILATHYKSQRTDNNNPTDTAAIRQNQAKATVEIMNKLRAEFGPDTAVMLAGDFNNEVHGATEFNGLYKAGFKDSFDVAPVGPGLKQRVTHYYFPKVGSPVHHQLDGILISSPDPSKLRALRAGIIADTDSSGRPLPPPASFRERQGRPSDHLAIFAEVQIQ